MISHIGLDQHSIFQPGGTATAVVGKWSGRYANKGINKKEGYRESWYEEDEVAALLLSPATGLPGVTDIGKRSW